jgi:hypothetical protein
MFIILYGVSCGFTVSFIFILGVFFGILIISCMSSYVAFNIYYIFWGVIVLGEVVLLISCSGSATSVSISAWGVAESA